MIRTLLTVMTLSFFVSPAIAFASKACKADVEKLCKDVSPGEGRVRQCMKDHEAELSAECKASTAKRHEAAKLRREACEPDRAALCKDVQAGAGRVAACMHANEAKLSAPCKAQIAGVKKQIRQVIKECRADLKTHCKDVKAGDGAKLDCLHEHAAELSTDCKEELDDEL